MRQFRTARRRGARGHPSGWSRPSTRASVEDRSRVDFVAERGGWPTLLLPDRVGATSDTPSSWTATTTSTLPAGKGCSRPRTSTGLARKRSDQVAMPSSASQTRMSSSSIPAWPAAEAPRTAASRRVSILNGAGSRRRSAPTAAARDRWTDARPRRGSRWRARAQKRPIQLIAWPKLRLTRSTICSSGSARSRSCHLTWQVRPATIPSNNSCQRSPLACKLPF
jgi:hypothetical protein